MSDIIFLISLAIVGTAGYDFYLLKKAGVKNTKCFISFVGTFFVSLIVALISFGILSSILTTKGHPIIPAFLSTIAVLGLSYFRFKGREIKKGQVLNKRKLKKEKMSPRELAADQSKEAVMIGYVIAVFSLVLVLATKNNSPDYLFSFIDPLIFALLAFWGQKKDPFIPLLIMTPLFIIGKLFFVIESIKMGGRLSGGLVVSVIIAYYLIKGLMSAYKIKFKKI
jgi:hypothetical protein